MPRIAITPALVLVGLLGCGDTEGPGDGPEDFIPTFEATVNGLPFGIEDFSAALHQDCVLQIGARHYPGGLGREAFLVSVVVTPGATSYPLNSSVDAWAVFEVDQDTTSGSHNGYRTYDG